MSEIVCVHDWKLLVEDICNEDGSIVKVRKCERCGTTWRDSGGMGEPVVTIAKVME